MTVPSKYAPIALFAYVRLDHLQQTVSSLLANSECSESRLYVFCDGWKREGQRAEVDAVRAYVDGIQGFESVVRVYRDENIGLARSIIEGVSYVLGKHGAVIVVEDDLVVSPHFLKFMNEGLQLYINEERVASIHGYCYPVNERLPETFFLRGADCWGWATWRRAWAYFESNGQKLLHALRHERLAHAFDMGGSYPYMKMLANQVAGNNDSWAVRWHAACFLRDMLTLYPGRSLVNNIGMDGSGMHCSATDEFNQSVLSASVQVSRIPLEVSKDAEASFARFLRQNRSVFARIMRRLRRFLGVSA